MKRLKKNLPNFLLIIIFLFTLISCNNFPKDPQDSWNEAKNEGLRVGVVNNPPFTSVTQDTFAGDEVDMVREFAHQNNLKVIFDSGNESDLIEKIENYQLHILIGGFVKKTIWKKKASTTSPYNKDHVFLIPKGENKLVMKLDSYLKSFSNNEK